MMNGFEYAGMDMVLASSFRAAIYCRLSKDDDLDGESASIANQRAMLETYCEKQGWEVVAVYQDDGYTGLNMERPDLKRMLKAIERRQINLVVTKDLSRLGRNYLQTGFLIEDFFPRNGVRYIAMNDGIDTMRDNNDIAPFKNILNPHIIVSERTQLLMPYHVLLDSCEEERLAGKAFGSTKSGIAPFYSDKYAKYGIQVADLWDETRLMERLEAIIKLR